MGYCTRHLLVRFFASRMLHIRRANLHLLYKKIKKRGLPLETRQAGANQHQENKTVQQMQTELGFKVPCQATVSQMPYTYAEAEAEAVDLQKQTQKKHSISIPTQDEAHIRCNPSLHLHRRCPNATQKGKEDPKKTRHGMRQSISPTPPWAWLVKLHRKGAIYSKEARRSYPRCPPTRIISGRAAGIRWVGGPPLLCRQRCPLLRDMETAAGAYMGR
jgi:hypothetical protein